jgi:hypothetical protein
MLTIFQYRRINHSLRFSNGWFFVGRPTLEELRLNLRAIMETRSDYRYEAYNTPEVQQIRIPQQTWENGAPLLGENGLPVGQGIVRWFDLQSGNGMIVRDGTQDEIFFNFTAIPGLCGYSCADHRYVCDRDGDRHRNQLVSSGCASYFPGWSWDFVLEHHARFPRTSHLPSIAPA